MFEFCLDRGKKRPQKYVNALDILKTINGMNTR